MLRLRLRTITRPPCGVAPTAFLIKVVSICWISPGDAFRRSVLDCAIQVKFEHWSVFTERRPSRIRSASLNFLPFGASVEPCKGAVEAKSPKCVPVSVTSHMTVSPLRQADIIEKTKSGAFTLRSLSYPRLFHQQ